MCQFFRTISSISPHRLLVDTCLNHMQITPLDLSDFADNLLKCRSIKDVPQLISLHSLADFTMFDCRFFLIHLLTSSCSPDDLAHNKTSIFHSWFLQVCQNWFLVSNNFDLLDFVFHSIWLIYFSIGWPKFVSWLNNKFSQ